MPIFNYDALQRQVRREQLESTVRETLRQIDQWYENIRYVFSVRHIVKRVHPCWSNLGLIRIYRKNIARSRREIRDIVFGDDHVRTEAEQRLAARQAIEGAKREKTAKPTFRVRAVPERNGIKIGNSFAGLGDVLAALAVMNGPLPIINPDDPRTESATTRLLPEEKQRLDAIAKTRSVPREVLIREAMRLGGLI